MNENIFAKVLEPALTRDNSAEGDYMGEDGLMMCGVCHKPKQFRSQVESLGIDRVVPCMCKCEEERRDAQEQREKAEETRLKIEAMKDYGLKNAQYRNSSFALDDGKDAKASEVCRKYVEKWEEIKVMKENGKGLLLHGDVGGGKTFLASCIANALIEKGVHVLMTNLPTLIHSMTANYGDDREAVLRKVATVPLLILDDFGMERGTPAALEKAYEIINTRYQSQKPLIITTNLTMDVIKNPKDMDYSRLYSRIKEMCPKGVKVTAAGRRENAARAGYEEINRILEAK